MKTFKDMKVGEKFHTWGDVILNYDYPKYCLLEKVDEHSATELLNNNERGISVLIDGNDKFLTDEEYIQSGKNLTAVENDKKYKPFTYYLNSWNGKEVYEQEKAELDKQIDLLLNLFSGLAQTSQGNPEDWKHRCEMMTEFNKLGISIKTALGIL